jgi:Domain of unknown function (DUF4166)
MLKSPIFQSIFGSQWALLPAVFKKHYANRGYSLDRVSVYGHLRVEMSLLAKILSPFMRLTGLLAPYFASHIPVHVHFESEKTSNAFCFNRIFYYPNQKPYSFRSRMVPIGGADVIEHMSMGLGWKARYTFKDGKVILEHLGYTVTLFGKTFNVPLEMFLGKGYAEEEALSENRFRMFMWVRHPIFGQFYAYRGDFKIVNIQLHG